MAIQSNEYTHDISNNKRVQTVDCVTALILDASISCCKFFLTNENKYFFLDFSNLFFFFCAQGLTYHVATGSYMSSDLANDITLPTVQGTPLRVNVYSVGGDTVATVAGVPIDLTMVDIDAGQYSEIFFFRLVHRKKIRNKNDERKIATTIDTNKIREWAATTIDYGDNSSGATPTRSSRVCA